MVSKSRYSVSFTLSVFEKTEAGKLIKEREINEYIKPYGSLILIKKTGITILAAAALTNLIMLFGLIFIAPNDPGFMERARYFSVTILVLVAIVFSLLFIYDFLMKKNMRKNNVSETCDDKLKMKIKINRLYIEQIMDIGSSKCLWNVIKKVYRKNGYIFIQREDNRCIVIPERVCESEAEIEKLYGFVKEQISKNNLEDNAF
ncbi:TPA_asm: YcxB family protein [Salmonella enterica subsp. enterica serovar Rubislaw str. ATCC 10717]|uniref:YcxB family protein n=1 Tax=Salmonella enterica subsp. enterica serovar Rubislaw str. ATCC 10717 TaxID=938143 RepID=A0A6W0P1T0_SALRU|nr:YcxB family protein [Salmonella enterica]EBY1810942.1 YcxB family protein [Salmonella enterica subsp. enterica serovar Rubislaw]ECF1527335.1 YcxB family protein [Salmonella enterica subsp. enterica serovar Rubislaw]SUF92965.1 Uncharacterised protein [Salmonella enterica]HAA1128141.1 YcxB family protein [Salmonella enterica subsp. enterica serovar Rubislaw str. ATCC 10717]